MPIGACKDNSENFFRISSTGACREQLSFLSGHQGKTVGRNVSSLTGKADRSSFQEQPYFSHKNLPIVGLAADTLGLWGSTAGEFLHSSFRKHSHLTPIMHGLPQASPSVLPSQKMHAQFSPGVEDRGQGINYFSNIFCPMFLILVSALLLCNCKGVWYTHQ